MAGGNTGGASGEALLEVREVWAGYHDLDILQGVNLRVERGRIVTIIGPNGAGKSTLAKAIFGLVRVRRGEIRFKGADITGAKPSRIVQAGLCYVPQERNVFPNLTVLENLQLGGYVLGARSEARIREMFEMFPVLQEKRHQKAGVLSGGQRQMLAMARALMLDPEMLVLDEPSAGLAPNVVEQVFQKIRDIHRSGRTILMVEQNARRALAMSDWGYVLDMGKNAIDDAGPRLLENPRVVELYLGTLGAAAGGRGSAGAEA
ncbi:MAG: ABC transporter ATP-binding protein [Firmicutes bacterium]|nr:ABC transporter ATP-binding protein [Bacillota bacterium]